MSGENKNRTLCIYQYLLENTDEDHPVTNKDICEYLARIGLSAGRKTVASDIELLQKWGYDIVCNRSRQNQYFIGSRVLELPELKLLVDAVQAARFISGSKSEKLIKKLMSFASPHQVGELKRQLQVVGKPKTANENIYYIVDTIYHAISQGRQITFQYYEYTPEKKRVLKHDGKVYAFSPYDLIWSNDAYYVFGFSESHGKVVKFRADRIAYPKPNETAAAERPGDYNMASFSKQVFGMYDGETYTVELLCENGTMKSIVDRFGDQVKTEVMDAGHFIATVEVSASPTFYAWIFMFRGRIQVISPQEVVSGYREHFKDAEGNHCNSTGLSPDIIRGGR